MEEEKPKEDRSFEQNRLYNSMGKYANNHRLRSLTPLERARRMPDWEMFFFAVLGREMTVPEKTSSERVRKEFFEENPSEAIAPITLAREYLDKEALKRKSMRANSAEPYMIETASRLCGSSLGESRHLASSSLTEIKERALSFYRRLDNETIEKHRNRDNPLCLIVYIEKLI